MYLEDLYIDAAARGKVWAVLSHPPAPLLSRHHPALGQPDTRRATRLDIAGGHRTRGIEPHSPTPLVQGGGQFKATAGQPQGEDGWYIIYNSLSLSGLIG